MEKEKRCISRYVVRGIQAHSIKPITKVRGFPFAFNLYPFPRPKGVDGSALESSRASFRVTLQVEQHDAVTLDCFAREHKAE